MQYLYRAVNSIGLEEIKELTIETRVGCFSDHEDIANPTGNENAFFYGISIDGQREQLTTFQPGEDGYSSMDEIQAKKFLTEDIKNILSNYGIYGE